MQNNPNEIMAAAWNGVSGRAWVDEQQLLDRTYESIERLLAGEALANGARQVLDIGCGSGATTLAVARALGARGRATGVDISAPLIDLAQARAQREGSAARFIRADAQTHEFEPGSFDLAISRFGVMFFDDPVAAFANIGRSLRHSGRLVMMVWQAAERNEWEVAIRAALADGGTEPGGPDPFSLGQPATVEAILGAAGFAGIDLTEARRPVYYGPDVPAALAWVRGFTRTDRALRRLDADAATRALDRLRDMLAAHASDDGIWMDSRTWIVTARRP